MMRYGLNPLIVQGVSLVQNTHGTYVWHVAHLRYKHTGTRDNGLCFLLGNQCDAPLCEGTLAFCVATSLHHAANVLREMCRPYLAQLDATVGITGTVPAGREWKRTRAVNPAGKPRKEGATMPRGAHWIPWGSEEERRLREMREEGERVSVIAQALGRTYEAIRARLLLLGIRSPRIAAEKLLAKELCKPHDLHDLAVRHGLTYRSVQHIKLRLKAQGVPVHVMRHRAHATHTREK